MYFFKKLEEFKDKKINIYVDMDGCIAEYVIGEKPDILNNKEGVYYNKRPLGSIINLLEEINKSDNIRLYILSACFYKEQKNEKNNWLDKYAPFFKKENRYILPKYEYNIMDTRKLKVSVLNEIINKDEINFIIEDSHSNIKEFTKSFPDIYTFHISELIK